jgi:hypothetical protein
METSDPAVRAAYLLGASEAVESASLYLFPAQVNELRHWLEELESWSDGQPPQAPYLWR